MRKYFKRIAVDFCIIAIVAIIATVLYIPIYTCITFGVTFGLFAAITRQNDI